MRYALHVHEQRDGDYTVEGPYDDYASAHRAGMVFARAGRYVTVQLWDVAAICDFCSGVDVTWSYDVEEFQVTEAEWGSIEGWAACDACHELIEAGRRKDLATRALREYFIKHTEVPDLPEVRLIVLNHIQVVHGKFWENKKGPGTHV